MILGVDLLEFLRIDDPIGAWPVHGLCGVWGTLSLGLFASGDYQIGGSGPGLTPQIATGTGLAGLFYGGGTALLNGARSSAASSSVPQRSPSP